MQDISRIYHNSIGISFQWRRDIQNGNTDIIQLVFRNTGFYLTYAEIKEFYSRLNTNSKLLLNIVGEAGVGKTFLLQNVHLKWKLRTKSPKRKVRIRSILGIAFQRLDL